jgi:hypothetical protein
MGRALVTLASISKMLAHAIVEWVQSCAENGPNLEMDQVSPVTAARSCVAYEFS